MAYESGPLTFGQLSTLRALQKWPRERWSEGNLVDRHRIADPDAGIDDVRDAVRTLARHHSALRTTFELADPGRPRQLVHDDVPDLLVVDGPVEADFDFGTDRGWRAALTLDDRGRPAELAFCMSHLVVDGWSTRQLALDLTPLVGGDPVDWDHARTSLRRTTELGVRQRGAGWHRRRRQAQAYWRDYFRRVPVDQVRTAGVGAAAAEVTRGVLALADRSADLAAIGRRAPVFPAGALLGLLALTLPRARTDDLQSVALMTSNRHLPEWRDLVTTANQQVPVLLRRPGPGELVLGFLAEVQAASLSAYRNGSYDVDMADAVAAEVAGTVPRSFGPLLNFTAGHAGPGPAANPSVGPAEHGIPTDVYVAVSSDLTVQFSAVGTVMPAAAVRSALEWIPAALRLTAEREDLRIGDLPALSY